MDDSKFSKAFYCCIGEANNAAIAFAQVRAKVGEKGVVMPPDHTHLQMIGH